MDEVYEGALRFNKDLWFYVKINTQTFETNLKIITVHPVLGIDIGADATLVQSDWATAPLED